MQQAGKKKFWLVKFAPFRTSWDGIVKAGSFTPRGIRCPQARNNLARMAVGALALFFHSQEHRCFTGILTVTRAAYPDPTSADPRWLTCDFAPLQTLAEPVSLAQIKTTPALANFPLIRQPRVAVLPLSTFECAAILHLASTPFPAAPAARQKPIATLVDRILTAKRTNPAADITVMEQELDGMVSALYGTSPHEATAEPSTPIIKPSARQDKVPR